MTVRLLPSPILTMFDSSLASFAFRIGDCSQSPGIPFPGVVASLPFNNSVAVVYINPVNGTTGAVFSTIGEVLASLPLFPAGGEVSQLDALLIGNGISSRISHMVSPNTFVVSATVPNTRNDLSYIAWRKNSSVPFSLTPVNDQELCNTTKSRIDYFALSPEGDLAVYAQQTAGSVLVLGTAKFDDNVQLSSLKDASNTSLIWIPGDLTLTTRSALPVAFFGAGAVGVYSRAAAQPSILKFRGYTTALYTNSLSDQSDALAVPISHATLDSPTAALRRFYLFSKGAQKTYSINSIAQTETILTSPQQDRLVGSSSAVLGYFDKNSAEANRNYRVIYNSTFNVASAVSSLLARELQWISVPAGQISPGFAVLSTLNTTGSQSELLSHEFIELWRVSQNISSSTGEKLLLTILPRNATSGFPTLCAAWASGALILLPNDDVVDVLFWRYGASNADTLANLLAVENPTCHPLRPYGLCFCPYLHVKYSSFSLAVPRPLQQRGPSRWFRCAAMVGASTRA